MQLETGLHHTLQTGFNRRNSPGSYMYTIKILINDWAFILIIGGQICSRDDIAGSCETQEITFPSNE